MTNFYKTLLDYYHITEEEFFRMTKEVTPEIFVSQARFDNMDDAVNLVNRKISSNNKIIVYGDYDADGIMGTSILVKAFEYKGYIVDYYIPSRYLDGYGINMNHALEIVQKGYGLVICVDNGVSANEPISFLRENGVDVIVLDHHEAPEVLPNANVIVHPFLSHYGEYSSSGAFVAFNFAISYLGRFDKYLSILAAISLISDMMPLREYNRDLLRIVFKNYDDGEFKQIDLLKGNEPFDENSIGMSIAPKINSIGRLIEDKSVNDIVRYFISENEQEILTYYSWIESINETRKQSSKIAAENISNINNNDYAIAEVVNEKEGLIGLIANALLNKYKKPSIVFTKDSSGTILKGSCRSQHGFNVVEVFNKLKDLMIASGGHELAGGCSIKVEDFEKFKKRFNEYAKENPICEEEKEKINLSLSDINFENYKLIKLFGPFGEEWKAPIFNLHNIKVSALRFSRDEKHILTPIGINSKLIGFNFPKHSFIGIDYVDFVGKFRTSTYKGMQSLEYLITEIAKN